MVRAHPLTDHEDPQGEAREQPGGVGLGATLQSNWQVDGLDTVDLTLHSN